MSKMPDIVYHGSLDEIEAKDFRPLTHFGTFKSALQRAGENSYRAGFMGGDFDDVILHQVSLRMNNPVRIRDGKNLLHSAIKMADMLYYTVKKITSDERDLIISTNEEKRNSQLVNVLKNKGYDGMVYKNCHEDAGKDSYIIFDSSQVVSSLEFKKISYKELLNSNLF